MAGVIVVGDLHLDIYPAFGISPDGQYNKLADLGLALSGFLRIAQERKCSHIVFTGDIFDNRTTIHSECIRTWGSFLRDCKDASVGVVVCQGNHDQFSESSSSLEGFMGMTLIQQQSSFRLGEIKVSFLPYTNIPSMIVGGIKRAVELGSDLIVGHFGMGDVELQRGFCEKDLPFSSEIPDSGPLAIIGHYHSHKVVKENVIYIGAPVGKTFAEANQKKVIIHVRSRSDYDMIPVTWVRQLRQITISDPSEKLHLEPDRFFYKIVVEGGISVSPAEGVVKIEKRSIDTLAPEIKRVIGLSNRQAVIEWMQQTPPDNYDEVSKIALRILEDAECS